MTEKTNVRLMKVGIKRTRGPRITDLILGLVNITTLSVNNVYRLVHSIMNPI